MIVLDTHVFVWWVAAPQRLSRPAQRALAAADERAISSISLWEIATLVSNGRLSFDRDVEAWLNEAVETSAVRVVSIDAEIAVRSTRLAANFHGDAADRLIAATAVVNEARLVTADETLRASSAVKTVW